MRSRFLRPLAAGHGPLLIPLCGLLALIPRILRGNSCGHDFNFHLISWMEIRRSWSEGVLYPHWAQSPNFSAGEARFIFYPPITSVLGALISYALHWNWIEAALIFLFLTLSGLTTRALARQFLPEANATLAGLIATATPYGLFTAYERGAFAELAAASFLPLLMLYALKPPESSPQSSLSGARRGFLNSTVLLTLVVALIWLTNAPGGVMASYLLAFMAGVAAVAYRRWWPVTRAVIAMVLGLGLASFYLVPAMYEQGWVEIHQALDVGMRISDSWLFARHAAPDMALHDQVLRTASTILAATAAAALAAFAVAYFRGKLVRECRVWWLSLALLVPAVLLLQFPLSAPIWSLPKMEFLQFPWRWLAVLGTPFAIFLAAVTPLGGKRARVISVCLWTALILGSTAMATLFFFQSCDSEDDPLNQADVFKTGAGVAGTDEYAPVGSDNSEIASELPDGCLVSDPKQELGESDPNAAPVWYEEQGSCDDTFDADLWQSEHKILPIETDQAGYLVMRLTRYPAWRITVNGKPAALTTGPSGSSGPSDPSDSSLDTLTKDREDGLIVLPVPAGKSTVDVRWTTTEDVWWGREMSALAGLGMIGLVWVSRRRKGGHLSS